MNISDFKKALPVLLRNNIVPFIWGYQGIGKTQSIAQVAASMPPVTEEDPTTGEMIERPFRFVHLHLATPEVGDLVGLLVHGADGTVHHARPEWFPTSGEGIIFLDELNRAHPDVIQAMFSFITSKTIHQHTLPSGWKIVAAGNYQNDQFNVTDTSDAAWMSRFCHVELNPTVGEFVMYAESKGADSVASFISEHSAMLETKPKEQEKLFVTPDRRSWVEMIAPLECEDMDEAVRMELYTGIIGLAASAAFFAHKRTASKAIKLKDILKDYSKVRKFVRDANKEKDTRFDLLSAPFDELVHKLEKDADFLTEKGVENVKECFLDLPLELYSQVAKKLGGMTFKHKDLLLNDPVHLERLTKRAA